MHQRKFLCRYVKAKCGGKNKKSTGLRQHQFLISTNSYLGIVKHYKTYKLRKKILLKYLSGWWWNQVYLSGGVAKFVLKTKITRL